MRAEKTVSIGVLAVLAEKSRRNDSREGGSGYLPKEAADAGIVPAAERRGRLSQGRNAGGAQGR